jgi:uncharacterized protein (DUF58 family)
VGSSLEFQDFRHYVPGDDLRHIDWAAYARQDELLIRLYREEISPHVEVVVDQSASMDSTPEKSGRTRELLRLFHELCRADRLTLTLWTARDRIHRHVRDLDQWVQDYQASGAAGLEQILHHPPRFRKNSVRIVLSDLLFPVEPRSLIRHLTRDASHTTFIQILDEEEADPSYGGGRRLTDVETGERLDLVVTAGACEAYKERLHRLQSGYRDELARAGGTFAVALARKPLRDVARDALRPARLLSVRGQESSF